MSSNLISVSKTLLLALLASSAFATPILEESDVDGTPTNAAIKPRATGDQGEPIDASFDVTGWPLSAEFNCYVMLCIMGGNRNLCVYRSAYLK